MAFGMKLDQSRITQADFNPARLNDPDAVGGWGAGASLNLPLYMGGRVVAGARAAGAMAGAEAASHERRRLEIAAGVVEAYFGAQVAEQGVRYADDLLAQARETERFMRERNAQDLALDADVARAAAFRAQAEAERAAALQRRASARSGLALVAGDAIAAADLATPVEALPPIPPVAPDAPPPADRPDLVAARLQRDAADAGVTAARGSLLPSLFAQASAETLREGNDLGSGGSWTTLGLVARWDLSLADAQATRAAQARARAAGRGAPLARAGGRPRGRRGAPRRRDRGRPHPLRRGGGHGVRVGPEAARRAPPPGAVAPHRRPRRGGRPRRRPRPAPREPARGARRARPPRARAPSAHRRDHTMKTASLAALVLLAPALAVASTAEAAAPRRVRPVQRETASGGHLVPASVLAARRATVGTRIAAHVDSVHVEEGQRVKQGQLLVSLADPDLRGALAGAQSAHAAAAAHERRIRALVAERAATASELEMATAQRAQAEAAVAAARANLGYAQIRAPFAGTIQARRVSAGDMVGPGQPLLELEGDELELQASLTEAEAHGLAVGRALPFVAGEARGTAEITALTPGGDPVSHRRGLRARVRKVDGELRSGAFARLEVPGAAPEARGRGVGAAQRARRARRSHGRLRGVRRQGRAALGLARRGRRRRLRRARRDRAGGDGDRRAAARCATGRRWRCSRDASRGTASPGAWRARSCARSSRPVIVLASILLGLVAVALTPREEEPQIVVPMVDVMVPFPGATPAEVESQVVTPLERRLWGIPGVEYLYSTSRPERGLHHRAVQGERAARAEPREGPPGAGRAPRAPARRRAAAGGAGPHHRRRPVPHGHPARARGAPARASCASSPRRSPARLADVRAPRRCGSRAAARRVVRVEPDPERLRTLVRLAAASCTGALESAQAQLPAGALVEGGARVEVEARGFARSAAELRRVVVAVRDGRPIYVEDVARVTDGPEPEPAVVLTASKGQPGFEQAATIVVAKRAGTNATELADDGARQGGRAARRAHPRVASRRPSPATTARPRARSRTSSSSTSSSRRSRSSPSSSLAMGWRSALVVGVAVPVTLALTLLLTYLNGYTLNRVTLFALIFSIGILVDDAIVVVENIHRHLHLPGPRRSFARRRARRGRRGREPHHPRHLRGHRRHPADGVRARAHGPVHAPHPGGRQRGDGLLARHRVRREPLGGDEGLPQGGAPARRPTRPGSTPRDPERDAPEPARDVPHANPETAPEGRLARLDRRVIRWLLGSGEGPARLPRRASALLLARRRRAPLHRRGEGEDAALRQQARVPGAARPARRHGARGGARARAGGRAPAPRGARGGERPGPLRAWPRRSRSSAWSATASCARRRSRSTSR